MKPIKREVAGVWGMSDPPANRGLVPAAPTVVPPLLGKSSGTSDCLRQAPKKRWLRNADSWDSEARSEPTSMQNPAVRAATPESAWTGVSLLVRQTSTFFQGQTPFSSPPADEGDGSAALDLTFRDVSRTRLAWDEEERNHDHVTGALVRPQLSDSASYKRYHTMNEFPPDDSSQYLLLKPLYEPQGNFTPVSPDTRSLSAVNLSATASSLIGHSPDIQATYAPLRQREYWAGETHCTTKGFGYPQTFSDALSRSRPGSFRSLSSTERELEGAEALCYLSLRAGAETISSDQIGPGGFYSRPRSETPPGVIVDSRRISPRAAPLAGPLFPSEVIQAYHSSRDSPKSGGGSYQGSPRSASGPQYSSEAYLSHVYASTATPAVSYTSTHYSPLKGQFHPLTSWTSSLPGPGDHRMISSYSPPTAAPLPEPYHNRADYHYASVRPREEGHEPEPYHSQADYHSALVKSRADGHEGSGSDQSMGGMHTQPGYSLTLQHSELPSSSVSPSGFGSGRSATGPSSCEMPGGQACPESCAPPEPEPRTEVYTGSPGSERGAGTDPEVRPKEEEVSSRSPAPQASGAAATGGGEGSATSDKAGSKSRQGEHSDTASSKRSRKRSREDSESDRSNSPTSKRTHLPSYLQSGGPYECSVCEDKCSGYHYDTLTCEGCKGFFRRSVQGSFYKRYQCANNGECKNSLNKATRTKCQKCRFEICLARGMKMERVQDDQTRQKNNALKRQNREKKLRLERERQEAERVKHISEPDRALVQDCRVALHYCTLALEQLGVPAPQVPRMTSHDLVPPHPEEGLEPLPPSVTRESKTPPAPGAKGKGRSGRKAAGATSGAAAPAVAVQAACSSSSSSSTTVEEPQPSLQRERDQQGYDYDTASNVCGLRDVLAVVQRYGPEPDRLIRRELQAMLVFCEQFYLRRFKLDSWAQPSRKVLNDLMKNKALSLLFIYYSWTYNKKDNSMRFGGYRITKAEMLSLPDSMRILLAPFFYHGEKVRYASFEELSLLLALNFCNTGDHDSLDVQEILRLEESACQQQQQKQLSQEEEEEERAIRKLRDAINGTTEQLCEIYSLMIAKCRQSQRPNFCHVYTNLGNTVTCDSMLASLHGFQQHLNQLVDAFVVRLLQALQHPLAAPSDVTRQLAFGKDD